MKNKHSILPIIVLVCALLSSALLPVSTSAVEPEPSESQLINISESCGSIRQNLKNLQRSDARARTYFGAIYETISSKYLKPLNLRLVDNDLANTELLEFQTSLATNRANFSDDYISYSKSLEEIISIDCRLEPEKFYEKLISVRKKRAEVAADVKKVNNLLLSITKSVKALKESF